MCIDQVRGLINDSNRIVVLSGTALMTECGLKGVRQEDNAYDIESRYGYSPEELASIEFLNRRVHDFYRYYKKDIIEIDKMRPTKAHEAIAELERRGKLEAVITRTVYGQHQMAGAHKIIELHGNVNQNKCPKCGRIYSADYITKSEDTPACEHCKVILRPGIALYGETMDNGLITKCAEAVEHADMLLIVGSSTHSSLTRYVLQYYTGNRLVTINEKPALGDECADFTIYGKCSDILSKLVF